MKIPNQLECFLAEHDIRTENLEELGGVNPNRGIYAYRAHSSKTTYIIKHCLNRREAEVYTKNAAFFEKNKIPIPKLYFSCMWDDDMWVVLEDIPQAFPKERWYADREQVTILFHLHFNSWNRKLNIKHPYEYHWNEIFMHTVESLLPEKITTIIPVLHEQVKPLFMPLCCLSGDPNPTNWAMRENGDLVLFDFEQIGYGHPAIDLAITMPGFGSVDGSLEKEIAQRYLSLWEKKGVDFPNTAAELEKQIVLAKLWISLDFLANHYKTLNENVIAYFIRGFSEKAEDFLRSI